MGGSIEVESVRPGEIPRDALARWREWRAARPECASPFFDPRYVAAAAEVAPWVRVALIRRHDHLVGILPYQRRAGRLQPLGAPLNDYHGIIAAPGESLDPAEVLQALGVRRFRFSGLVGSPGGRAVNVGARRRLAARLDCGFEAWAETRQKSFLKDKRRRLRNLERDHGAVTFTLERATSEDLDLIIRLKRRQMAKTGQVDVFARPWTRDLLRRLALGGEPDFGLFTAKLAASGRVIAAEVGLRSGDVYHLWFPVYEPGLAAYSPGALMTLETLKVLAERGVREADFGPEGEGYKTDFADPVGEVNEGDIIVGPLYAAVVDAARQGLSFSPALRRFAKRVAQRLDRRHDRILALHPELNGLGASAGLVASLGKRRKVATAAVATAVGIGGLTLMLTD